MAKTSMIMREKRREKLVKQHAAKRAQLKEAIRSPKSTDSEREEAQRKLRDSSASRVRNRCAITGRSRGVYRKFGLGRQKLREATMRGDIPGLGKASW